MPDNRRRAWVWIIPAVAMVPVLYVLSFGPACWIGVRMNGSKPLFWNVYLPIRWAWKENLCGLGPVINVYARLGLEAGVPIVLWSDKTWSHVNLK